MSLLAKTANSFVKTCAAAVTIGVALAPSSALAVTTWNWSFITSDASQFGSGTFTTVDGDPTIGTTYQITGITGTYNRGGTAYTITELYSGTAANSFQWSGDPASSILTAWYDEIHFVTDVGSSVEITQGYDISGYAPIDRTTTTFSGSDGLMTSSSLVPVSSPPGPSTAAPGPLPLLGAAAAFQASRRLRRRLSGSLPAA
jgi:hypothetical protein